MAIVLGGITLPDLSWEDDLTWTGVESRVYQTLGGQVLVWEQKIAGRPIDLAGGSHWGWIDRNTLESLAALASVPNTPYPLIYEGREWTVRFRHEDTAIEASPILPRPNPSGQDYYNHVRIRLMEVEAVTSTTTA